MAKPPVKRQQLIDLLAQGLREGRPGPGEWMPSERQLVEEHAVGRATARQALQALAERGLVEYVPDVGYTVAGPPAPAETGDPVVPPASLAGIHDELRAVRSELQQMNSRLAALEDRGCGCEDR